MFGEFKAIFRHGAFVPQEPCPIPEGTEVRLIVQQPALTPPRITDPIERAAVLRRIVDRMKQNPLPSETKPFTRDELHERR